jgi:hypothetical protein
MQGVGHILLISGYGYLYQQSEPCILRPIGKRMEDQDVRQWIDKLVHEEQELFRQEAQGGATEASRERRRELEEYLDQCWDLLRQRRAKRLAGQDPEAASVRDVGMVEHYEQ